ncbi:MAG: PilZ domain-containing protein [Nitrospirota bacterium]
MVQSKRKFRRFDLVRDIKFRPTYGATEYFSGTTRNLSSEGLALHANDFKFIMYENLDLIVSVPGSDIPASLSGDVMWKEQDGARCMAGVKFRMKNKIAQEEAVGNILSASGFPINYMYNSDFEYEINKKSLKQTPPEIHSTGESLSALPNKLGFIKRYTQSGDRCKVTFRLLKEAAKNTQDVALVGDFNDWDEYKSPMTRLPNGDFVVTLDLESRREFRFRYLIDGHRWEVDRYADKFVRNDKGFKDSVVIV